jgi:DHA2 family multidrug resistance protein
LLDYPTLTSGIMIAPRGVGTMLAMIIAGRTLHLVDARSYATFGLLLISLSLYQMTKFDLYMDSWPLIYSGFIQGIGMGLSYAALTTISFSTLAPEMRADGAAISSLMRNLGSSIGVSLLIAFLSRNTQINHAEIAESISAGVLQSDAGMIERNLALGFSGAAELLNAELTRQALMISYLNNFKLMMFITLAAAPLAYLMDRPATAKAEFTAE